MWGGGESKADPAGMKTGDKNKLERFVHQVWIMNMCLYLTLNIVNISRYVKYLSYLPIFKLLFACRLEELLLLKNATRKRNHFEGEEICRSCDP